MTNNFLRLLAELGRPRSHSGPVRYGLALVVVALATGLTLAMREISGNAEVGAGYVFLTAIIFASWYGGLAPGFFAAAVAIVAFQFFFVKPPNEFKLPSSEDEVRLAVFLVTSLLVVAFSYSARTAHEGLDANRHELQDFLENGAVGLHWVGPDGAIQWANQAEMEMLGYPPEDYIGHHIAEFHVKREVIDDILARLRRGETIHNYPAQLRTRDERTLDVLIDSNVLWKDGEFIHTRCFTRDVTAERQAHRALIESEERLEAERAEVQRLYEREAAARMDAETSAARTEALEGLAAALVEAATPAEIGEALLTQVSEVLGAATGRFLVIDSEAGLLRSVASRGFDSDTAITDIPVDSANSRLSIAFSERRGIFIGSSEEEKQQFPNLEGRSPAWASVPVIARDEVVAVVGSGWPQPRVFSTEDIDLLFAFARLAGQALDRARLYSTERSLRARAELSALQISRLQAVTSALADTMTQSEASEVVLREGMGATGAHSGIVAVLDRSTAELAIVATRGLARNGDRQSRFHLSDDIPMTEAAKSGSPVLVRSREDRSRFSGTGFVMPDDERSWATVPIVHNNEVFGVLHLAWSDEQAFDEDQVRLMETLARQTGQALERARLYQSEQQARRAAERSAFSLGRLHASRSALAMATTPAAVAEVIVREGAAAMEARFGTLALLDEDGKTLKIAAYTGYDPEVVGSWGERGVPLETEIHMAEAVRERQAVYCTSRDQLAARYPQGLDRFDATGVQALAALPLMVDERCYGTLTIAYPHPKVLSADERALLQAFANQAAQSLDRARLYAAERDAREEAERAAERLGQLQTVTAALAEAATIDDVQRVFAETSVPAAGAWAGTIYLKHGLTELRALSSTGYTSMESDFRNLDYDRFPELREVVESGRPAFIKDIAQLGAHGAAMIARNGNRSVAWALLPLRHEGSSAGMVVLSYSATPSFDHGHRQMLVSLGGLLTQALDRARLYDAEGEARRTAEAAADRLARLQAVTAALSEAMTMADVQSVFLKDGVTAGGAWAGSMYLLDDDRRFLNAVATTGDGPAEALNKRLDMERFENVRRVIETSTAHYMLNPDEMGEPGQEMSSQNSGRSRSWALVPIVGERAAIGMLVFSFEDEAAFDDSRRELLMTLGRQFSQAIARAQLYEAERSLRSRLNAVVSDVPGVVWESWSVPDARGKRADFVSGYVEQMLGYSVDEWLSKPGFWLSIVHPEDREMAAANAAEALASGRPSVNRFRWVRKDGGVIHVLAHSSVIFDDEGNPAGMRGVTVDVSEERRAQEALRESEAMAQAVLTAAANGILTIDERGVVLTMNPAAEHIFGYGASEVVGKNVAMLMPPPDNVRHDTYIENYITTGEAKIIGNGREVIGRRKDGSTFPIELAISEVDLDGRRTFTGIVNDVSQRRRAQRGIEFLVHASKVLSSSLDYETTLKSLAHLAVPAIGDWCAIDIWEGDRLERLALVHSEGDKVELVRGLEQRMADIRAAEATHKAILQLRPRLLTEVPQEQIDAIPDPERREIMRLLNPRSVMAVPLTGHQENLGMITLVTAESERRYEDVDLELAEELGRRAGIAIENARLYRESQKVQAELRRANESKDEFLGMVSHELRTPITSIYGGARFLHLRGAKVDEKTRDELIVNMEQESERLYRLIENLLALARLDLGQDIPTEPVLLGTLVEKTTNSFKAQHPQRQVQFRNRAEGVMVLAEPTYVEQVIQNLLSNAEKYSPPGTRLDVSVQAEGTGLTVSVADRGPGVAPEETNLIFESFYRSSATAARAPGKGLGLTVCKRLIEAQKGKIWARPRQGGGLEVLFHLPIAGSTADTHMGKSNGSTIERAQPDAARV